MLRTCFIRTVVWLAGTTGGQAEKAHNVMLRHSADVHTLSAVLAFSTPFATWDAWRIDGFSQTMLDLLVLSLELQDLDNVSAERDLYARMMIYIRRQLVDPDLNIESLARAHHVSIRTVTRAFARHKKTPMAVIWQERLRASREALERGRVSSVSQAALDFGFSDFSHFSHAFRKAFGISPRSLLPKEQQGATPSNRHTGSDS